jgi:predicted enzyme related to lactoylglutathione lyase
MKHSRHNGVVHLELHTHDLAEVRTFMWQLLGWQSWPAGHDYHALSVSDRVGGGIVECGQRPPSWLPYVGVGDVQRVTEQACQLGASVRERGAGVHHGYATADPWPACGAHPP